MSYINADQILPDKIIRIIQQYVDGKSIYIPRKTEQRQRWGNSTGICKELAERNNKIYKAYNDGKTSSELSEEFYLSIKSIQRIIHDMK